MINDELRGATDDLREAVGNIPIPPFGSQAESEANEPVPILKNTAKLRRFPIRALSIAASVVLIAAGTVGALQLLRDSEEGAIEAADAPDSDVPVPDPVPVDPSWENGVTGNQPLEETLLTQPEPGQSIVDPTFNTTIEVVENISTTTSLMPLQARPAWNADGSRLLTYRSSGVGFSLVDPATLTEIKSISISPADIEEVYWHPTNPELLYYVDNSGDVAQLKSFALGTDSVTTLHSYEGCLQVGGVDSVRISTDTLLLGQLCESADGPVMVSVNIETGETISQPAGDFGAPQPTPSSGRYVVRDSEGNVSVLDDKLQPTGVEFFVGDSYMTVVETQQGQELLATSVFSGDQVGALVVFDLANGSSEVIIGPDTGYPSTSIYGPMPSLANDGRLAMATLDRNFADTDISAEILVVDLDESSPEVTRIAHHRSTAENALDPSWSRSYPSLHPLRPVVAVASDWGGEISSPLIISD